MLEERMSNTYSQHSIGGYNLPPQRNMYPSVPSNFQAGAGGAESFYTASAPQNYYPSPQQSHNYPPQQYAQQYPIHDPRASAPSPGFHPEQGQSNFAPLGPQRTGSWQTPAAPAPYGAPIGGQQSSTGQAPQNATVTSSVDPNASFYYGNAAQPSAPAPQQSQDDSQPQYPIMQSPSQQHAPLPHQSPQQFAHQPAATQHAPPQQHQAQAPQPYWQAQQQQPQPTSSAPAGHQNSTTHSGYTQDSFPNAPHHAPQPQPAVVEESLIEF